MNYNYQIIKAIIVNLENRVTTFELDNLFQSPNSWQKSVYRLCRKNIEKIERERMSYDKFKIKNKTYFNESERGKWNRKISTLTASNLDSMKEDTKDMIQKIIVKLERRRLDKPKLDLQPISPSRLAENFNRRKWNLKAENWDIPIQHIVKKTNWREL
ncbi:hypothetical protein CH354_07710 [Leptospira levettii]|uniref:hypothetical protein n=1 Tax=Leptospira levettii TaxID=2023178 RepID=UPI000C2976FA|nr:hypothetical protein [Leptospira levettii]PJZ36998.1 hypothetical protein CH354_07710 [Leptospira levettii]